MAIIQPTKNSCHSVPEMLKYFLDCEKEVWVERQSLIKFERKNKSTNPCSQKNAASLGMSTLEFGAPSERSECFSLYTSKFYSYFNLVSRCFCSS